MPAVEEIGSQPVPREQRTGTWVDLFTINFAFGINPRYFVLGKAVWGGGVAALAYLVLQPGQQRWLRTRGVA